MPYSITTKDGITINNIPDDVAPDSPELKARVAAIRSGGGPAALEQPEKPGFFAGLVESVTGSQRATPETQTLPEWTSMPELNQMSVASFKTALGTLMSNPKETVQILQANFPGVQVSQDAKGNFLLKSSVDGKQYAIPPGFSMGDIPRAIGGLAAFTPAGRATTLTGAGLAGAGTQAAIEASQAATGGTFDTKEVALAGVTGAGGQAVAQVLPKVVQGVKQVTGRAPKPAPAPAGTVPPVAPAGPSKTSSLFDDWVQKSRAQAPGIKDVFSAISRRAQAAPDVDFELRMVKTSDAVPTQVGEDYLNASSMGTAEKIAKSKSIQDIDRVEDVLPIRLDENMRIIDGNHRHAAAVFNKDEYIQALVPVGKGTGKVVNLESIKQGAPVVAPKAPAAPVAPAAAPAAQTTTEAAVEVGDLVRKASGGGLGSKAARDRLADLAAVNPEAKAAADRLGLELPFDVFSDNPQIRAAVGLTRSAAGSEAEAAWRTTVSKAVDKADDVIKQFDATFVEGAVAPGVVSQKVRDSLTKTRTELSNQADAIYKRVNETVPKQSIVTMPKLKETLDTIISEVGEGGLSAQEKKLFKMIQDGDVTYGRLRREKNLVGQAVAGKDSPYGNMEAGDLKRLYAALADDQLGAVGEIGGEALRQELRGANLLYAKERALGKRIINAFGEDVEGSIASKMRLAITSAAKGDSADFMKLMKLVPEDLRKETVATALASVTRSGRGAERGAFGFSEFADLYPKLRANAPIYKQVVDALGPEAHKTMRDLYEVSKRITEARANVLTTGKANQALVESMKAEGLVAKVMESTAGKAVTTGVAAMGGGPIAAAATTGVMSALSSGKKDAIEAAGKLFASDEFQKLAIEAATKADPSKEAIKRLSMSQSFKNFAKAANLPRDPGQLEQWIVKALQTERQFDQENQ